MAKAKTEKTPKPEEEEKQSLCVIAVGSPFDCITLYGDETGQPFPDADIAAGIAEVLFKNETWWLPSVKAVNWQRDK